VNEQCGGLTVCRSGYCGLFLAGFVFQGLTPLPKKPLKNPGTVLALFLSKEVCEKIRRYSIEFYSLHSPRLP
jgi:hypothetical protein